MRAGIRTAATRQPRRLARHEVFFFNACASNVNSAMPVRVRNQFAAISDVATIGRTTSDTTIRTVRNVWSSFMVLSALALQTNQRDAGTPAICRTMSRTIGHAADVGAITSK
jgi:hypothetical protein